MYTRILVATDGSTLSRKAVKDAIALCAAVGADLVALNVVPRYPVSYFEGGASISPQDIGRMEKEWADKSLAIVEAVRKTAEAAGVKAKGVLAKSDIVSASILTAAKKHKCDLIVMASHGRKGISRILLGSETQQVLTHSTIPVLVLR
ncbi:universal stress protein [Polaromonas sp. YR568]|uniref:universal stress protein n=1 Tax=Polaromonas sp. YR568 TaxID=1855301 RepID=UPI003137B195